MVLHCHVSVVIIRLSLSSPPPTVPPYILTLFDIYSTTRSLVVLEVLLSGAMLSEIILRWIAMKNAFFSSKGNLFDLVMAVLVAGLTVLMVVGWQRESKVMAEAEALVVIGRNAVQAIRLWRLVDRYHNTLSHL